ncbi:MAG: sugar phosphate isomerase/epimerase [Proteobacteria bacterium]|nr:sugar phosphate isomerase/epimerase [Pseudomonadota bacterium]
MRLGLNLLLWSPVVTPALFPRFAQLKAAGYDGVELPLFEGTPEHYHMVGEAVRDAGLRCTGLAIMPDAAHDCSSGDAAVRAAALAHLTWAIDCIAAAGGEVLCGPFHQPLGVFSGSPPTADEVAHVVEVHRAAARHAAAQGVTLAVEPLNRFECYLMNTVEAAAAVVDAVQMPNYGMLYDTFHANIEEKDPVGVIAPHLARIGHVHLSENDRGMPGQGHIPWAATLSALRIGGYDGWCVIEAFGRALPEVAAATRVWRDFFHSDEELVTSGHDFLRAQWRRLEDATATA